MAHNAASSSSTDARALRSAAALRAAMLALLEQMPLDQITVRDICAESGVHYATFFRHFPSKEALLEAVAADQIAELVALSMGIRGTGDYVAGTTAMCRYVDEHRELWATLLNGGAGAAMRAEWVRQSQLVAAAETPVNSWMPPDLGTICAATLIAETLAWWVAQPPGARSVDYISALLLRLLTGSVMAPD
jgi:AcrR family transcriptional regulator